MVLSLIWTAMVALSLLFAVGNGTLQEVSAAAVQGASDGVELCISMAGTLCLWSGVMEVLRRGGALRALSAALRPVLSLLYPEFRKNEEVMGAVSANVSANLLGLGNAATPFGIKAACAMAKHCSGTASDALCMLVVCNTASIQLIPTTVAAVRASAGSAAPLDILPAVWLASALSVTAGILAVKVLSGIWRDKWNA